MLPDRFTWIDDTNRDQHSYLEPTDRCLFLGEYFSGKGYQGGGTNQLILNLKIKPTALQRNPARERYKTGAITEIARALGRILQKVDKEEWTWVPIPTSKCAGHPDYDPRLHQILRTALDGHNTDIRLLLRQTENTEADHEAISRMGPDELHSRLEVDLAVLGLHPIRGRGIILFDDVLTTGKHFKTCMRRLREVIAPDTTITGVFVARRVLPRNDV